MPKLNVDLLRWTPQARTALALSVYIATLCNARANDDADKAREEMQRRLNEQVMSTPFNPGDVKRAEAFAEQAKRKGIPPIPSPPSYWQPGWTCANVAGYAYYNYMDYRNCIYFNRYHGYYWR
jgi:hypothetical protein